MAQDNPLFVIDDDPIVPWPVTVSLPAAGGKFAEYQFTVLMRVLSPEEYEKLFAEAPGTLKPVEEDVDADAGVEDVKDVKDKEPRFVRREISEIMRLNVPIFQRLITGWEGVTDREGNAVAYTPEKLAEQVTGPRAQPLSTGLWRAISEVRYGMRLDDGTTKDGAALGN